MSLTTLFAAMVVLELVITALTVRISLQQRSWQAALVLWFGVTCVLCMMALMAYDAHDWIEPLHNPPTTRDAIYQMYAGGVR